MDAARRATDKELARIEKRLTEIYGRASKEIGEKADKYFQRFAELDKKKRALVESGDITEADYKKWRQGKIMTGEHWKEMQRQTAQRLTQADGEAQAYINGRMPSVYSLNYNSVAEGLESAVKGYSFELVDAATVRNLATSDKTLLPYKTIDGKKAERWHTQRVNAEVMQGILQGESVPQIARRMKTNVGMTAKGSAVRNARTSVTSAENKGRMDMLHNAEGMGIVTQKEWVAAIDSHTRESHAEINGETVDMDEEFSNGLMYPGDPDGEPAEVYNCFVGDTKTASDSEIVRSYCHEYEGVLIKIKTASGVSFTCTPNHPILCGSGWVKANLLNKGDHILVTSIGNSANSWGNPNINHILTRMDALHKFLDIMRCKRTCALGVNFHGDVSASNVEIIAFERFLWPNGDSFFGKRVYKFLLKLSNKSASCESALFKHLLSIWFSALCFVCRACKSFAFFWRRLCHSQKHRFRARTRSNANRLEPESNNASANSIFLREPLDGFPGTISEDKIVDVDRIVSKCHVFNLQTENGYYFVNSIIPQTDGKCNGKFAIAQNCRCRLGYKIVEIGGRKVGNRG